jgi:hypothetical protein
VSRIQGVADAADDEDEAPAETPVETAPVETTPVAEVPVEDAPATDAPVDETPAPVADAPAEDAPAEAGDTAVDPLPGTGIDGVTDTADAVDDGVVSPDEAVEANENTGSANPQ